jgi:hypothetical protein
LIDYGLSLEYTKHGKHIEKQKNIGFVGNCSFSSHNAFHGVSLSRRDDLISTCYILTYLLRGDLFWEQSLDHLNWSDYYKVAAKIKKLMTPKKLCTGGAKKLLPFAQAVF